MTKDLFNLLHICAIFLALMTMTSCRTGQGAYPYDIPSEALDDAIQTMSNDPLISYDESLPENWWTLFNDDQLSAFIQQALVTNPTLQSAKANILLAAYNADGMKSILFPNFTLGGDVLREKLSKTGLIPFNNSNNTAPPLPPLPVTAGANGIPVYFTQYETEITLNYDFDIWGKNRKLWQAALGVMRANAADENFTRLQVGIAVAQVYYQLQINYQREEIARMVVENQINYLNMIERRFQSNIDNNVSVQIAEANVSSSKENLLQIQANIAVYEYQLKAYLAGNFQEEIHNIEIAKQPLPKVPLPADLPLHLIAYRPDIIAQLWLIQSAGKQIEAAQAGFYPDFSMTGLLGFQTIHLHKLFTWPSTYYNVDPAFTLPIFDGGRLLANLRGSEINYDLAILKYNNLILNAVQEVLSSLAGLNKTEQQFQEYKNQLNNQVNIFELTKLRMENSLSSELDVLVSEYSLLFVRDKEMMLLGNTIQAILSLVKALGGGYQACYIEG